MRESWFLLIFCFPPWGKANFRWILIFPHEGKPFFAVFLFSLIRESRFSLNFDFPPWGKANFPCFLFIRDLGQPIFLVFLFIRGLGRLSFSIFCLSETSDSLFFLFFIHPRPRTTIFFDFLLIRDLGQPIFLIFYSSETSDSQEAMLLILDTRRKTRKLLSPAWLLIMLNSAQLELGLFNCSQIPRNSTVLRLQSRLEKKPPPPLARSISVRLIWSSGIALLLNVQIAWTGIFIFQS